jgi:hypothetical protein
MEKNYQFKITLRGIKPAIYRTFVVKENISFFEFHHVVQIVMGWFNEHFFQFTGQDAIITDPEFVDYGEVIDIQDFFLNEYFKDEGDKIQYEYDFGDTWIHDIVLEKITDGSDNDDVPKCLTGKRNCPPENCGGVFGYEDLVNVMSDVNHPEFEEMVEWYGERFDPEYFELDEVNTDLAEFMDDFPDSVIDIFLN